MSARRPTPDAQPTPAARPRRPRRGRRLLLVTLLVLVALVAGATGYHLVSTAPAGTPQAVEFADATVSDELASATVLALGEATHGTAEFQTARRQLVEKLAGRGFTTIAYEVGAGSASQVDAWLQGGPGTAEEATKRFGFSLYHTRETADLLTWIRDYNQGRPDAERIRLYGIDIQDVDEDKALVLDWLKGRDAAAARSFEARLAQVNGGTRLNKDVNAQLLPVTRELVAAVDRLARGRTDDAALRARLSARALEHGRARVMGVATDTRDPSMAELLGFLVEERAARGGRHTLLFGHNGHLDKAGQATTMRGDKLGQLASRRWGAAYKAIGTDGRVNTLGLDDGTVTVTVNSPIRGLFAGTRAGYLEFASATPANREVLSRPMPMLSAGAPFLRWYAWVPMWHQVTVVPEQAWDALVYFEETHPVTPLP